MRDLQNDPNFAQDGMHEYDSKVQWAAVGVILLLCAGLIVAASFSGNETQTAMNSPAVEQPAAAPVTGMPPRRP